MKNIVKSLTALVSAIGARGFALLAFAFALLSSFSVWAQPTNTPAGVASVIDSGVSAAYDTAITIGVAVMAIGAVIFFVRKGLKARM